MPTRNIYVKLSASVQAHLPFLEKASICVWAGAIPLLFILSQIWGPQVGVGIGGRAIWSTLCVANALICCGHWINPDRDPVDQTPRESYMVFMLNLFFIFSIVPWFWED